MLAAAVKNAFIPHQDPQTTVATLFTKQQMVRYEIDGIDGNHTIRIGSAVALELE
jgi:hypothetical protein